MDLLRQYRCAFRILLHLDKHRHSDCSKYVTTVCIMGFWHFLNVEAFRQFIFKKHGQARLTTLLKAFALGTARLRSNTTILITHVQKRF
jgi:hypothetical protein